MSGPDFEMPLHVVDQYAARMRDSGLPPAAIRLVISTVATTTGQLADVAEMVAPAMTSEEVASLVRGFATAWDQLLGTL
jgi:hypothetical protein